MFNSKRAMALGLALSLGATFGATAQTFPTKPVRIIVAYPAGGISDVVTRVVADGLSKKWGQPVLVENKPGASSTIGTQFVVRSEPDGYTLLNGDRALTINAFSYDKLPYDATKDLVPVVNMISGPLVVAVSARSPYNSMADLFKAAAAAPNKLTYGSFGKGTITHIDTELILKRAGVTAVHVPYKGLADVSTAVLAGDIDFALLAYGIALPHAKSGKLKVLGYMADKRQPELPNVPSAAELKLPESSSWMGILAPAGTPRPVVEKIARDIKEVMAEPVFMEKIGKPFGVDIVPLGPQDFAKMLEDDRKTTATIVQTVDVKKE